MAYQGLAGVEKNTVTNEARWLFCNVNHSTPAPLGQTD